MLKHIDPEKVDTSVYPRRCMSCLVITHDGKILLQRKDWGKFAGWLCAFGGGIDEGETPIQGLIREINEELGASVDPKDVQSFGAVTEDYTDHSEFVYLYIWHDTKNTITGCYEGEMESFASADEALAQDMMMEEMQWLLRKYKTL
jgi:8-oxo-dGTP diphosphatase